ncbi:MAG: DNA polymerase III subunit delta [Bacteroidales bacterium]
MLFKEVIGQNQIKEDLLSSVHNNRISHAQLFCGPEGSGNLPLALAYAQYINCTNKQENDACGNCPSCIKFNKLAHPDLHFVFPVATNKKIKKHPVSDNFIEEWRHAVREQPYLNLNYWYNYIEINKGQGSIQNEESSQILKKLQLKTYESEYKIMIIWMAEKMNVTCANKLLKIFEEPPEKTLFLLLAENTDSMLQTILSRTQIRYIPKIDKQSLSEKLSNDYNLEQTDLQAIVHNANGNYLKANRLAQSEDENKEFFTFFTQLMRLSFAKNLVEATKLSDTLAEYSREKQKSFIQYSLNIIRENFILNQQQNDIVYLYKQERDFSEKFHIYIHERNIAPITKELNEVYFHIERNGNAKIIFFDLIIKLMILLRA